MSEIRVTNVIGENGSSPVNFTQGINMSGIVTATSFVPTVGQLSHRNVLINGAMNIAQRYTSSTTHPAYGADRWRWGFGNHSAGTVTASQQSLSSSDTPYTLGFRKYTRLALGQAGTAAANTYISMRYKVEAQDIAQSGWNYNSASSDITISFWFRCSTNQTFYFEVKSEDGTPQSYVFSFTASGNNTWTKITKTIPGNSNLQIDNDNGSGLALWIYQFYGTDYTNNKTLDQWAAYSGSNVMPDMASTWLTAGASTWDLTGVQLEVGPVATPFEHRSYCEELARCQRYFAIFPGRSGGIPFWQGYMGSSNGYCSIPVPNFNFRAVPTPTDATTGTSSSTGNIYNAVGDNINSRFAGNGTVTLSCGGYAPSGIGLIMDFGAHQSGAKEGVVASWNGAVPGIFLSAEL